MEKLGRRHFLKMVAAVPVVSVALPAISKEVKPEIPKSPSASPSVDDGKDLYLGCSVSESASISASPSEGPDE